jgi:hypothetical protein
MIDAKIAISLLIFKKCVVHRCKLGDSFRTLDISSFASEEYSIDGAVRV